LTDSIYACMARLDCRLRAFASFSDDVKSFEPVWDAKTVANGVVIAHIKERTFDRGRLYKLLGSFDEDEFPCVKYKSKEDVIMDNDNKTDVWFWHLVNEIFGEANGLQNGAGGKQSKWVKTTETVRHKGATRPVWRSAKDAAVRAVRRLVKAADGTRKVRYERLKK